MTEEEIEKKAEEYAKSEFPEDEFKQQIVIKSLLYGYKQGQENCNCVHTDNSKVIFNLQKENEQLKATITKMRIAIAEKNSEVEELKKDKEYLDNANNEQTEVIMKLNEQIEKMKCCGNCKHFDIDDNERLNCVLQFIHCTNRDEWELAE